MVKRFKNLIGAFVVKLKPKEKNDVVRLIVLITAVGVLLFATGKLIHRGFYYVYEDFKNRQIAQMRPEENENPFDLNNGQGIGDTVDLYDDLPYEVIVRSKSFLNEEGILFEYQKLRERNNDLAGWLVFPGFRRTVSYPVLYSGDNDFYLFRDFDKNNSYSGSLFFDGNNTPYHENPIDIDRNYVIYGHSMRNNTMFGHLSDYWRNESSQKNVKIYLDLMNTRLEYEVFSTFTADENFNYRQISFSDDNEYLDYLNKMLSLSTKDFGVSLEEKDKIITLSTCYRTGERTAIIGRLVRQIIYLSIEESESSALPPVYLPDDMPMNEPTPALDRESEPPDITDSSHTPSPESESGKHGFK